MPANGVTAEDTAATNRVEKSLKERGTNSYYYAHGGNMSGSGAEMGVPMRPITDYAWTQEGDLVKVYVTWRGRSCDGQVQLDLVNEDKVELKVEDSDGSLHGLSILLFDRVLTATVKRRAERLIIVLAKVNKKREWLSLSRKPWETLP